ncbi:MAG TPA: alpha/beta hydrolase [Flavobacterium sp.]|jgi:acetyl esterase/lipase|nr:alpha/beta hydrolase [Flavobacterium sp.]
MKKYTLPVIMLFLSLGCNNTDGNNINENLPARELYNVSYGNNAEQLMDIYLPAGRTDNTKTIILVHGGGWSGGSKSDFNYVVPVLKAQFPDYAIVNMNYRLGTAQSPGFPKQIQDIELLISHLKTSDYQISDKYAFIGASAGAHLSLLYSYYHDPNHEVKAVCSIVGPTDFTDPAYTNNPLFQYGLMALVGNVNYQQHPEVYIEVSPTAHVTSQSPPTIMFYGGQDPLIPASQATRLKEKLDDAGVYNEYNLYPYGGHGNWNLQTMADFQTKLVAFLKNHF